MSILVIHKQTKAMGCCSVQWQHPPHWSTSPSWRCGLGHRRSSRDRSIPRYTLANVSIDHIVAVTTQKSTKWRKKKKCLKVLMKCPIVGKISVWPWIPAITHARQFDTTLLSPHSCDHIVGCRDALWKTNAPLLFKSKTVIILSATFPNT